MAIEPIEIFIFNINQLLWLITLFFPYQSSIFIPVIEVSAWTIPLIRFSMTSPDGSVYSLVSEQARRAGFVTEAGRASCKRRVYYILD